MKRHLYSELRTIYETTAADPHTFRVTMKLKHIIDGGSFRRAVETTMERYPYFRVRMRAEGNDIFFEDNDEPVPVLNTNERIVLGGDMTSGHLIAFCYWKNRIYIDVYHGLTDGGGIAPLLRTLLYYYCGAFYGIELPSDGTRLSGGIVSQAEWDDPAESLLPEANTGLASKWDKPAFKIEDGGIANITSDSIVFNIRMPEESFMRFNISNDGSPATIVSLLLARTIDELHPGTKDPPVIAICVNQRKALRAPLAHQSLVGDVRLPYTGKLRSMPFSMQATCFRGIVTLQSDNDMILDDIRDYQALIKRLNTLDSVEARRAFCVHGMETLSECITATVSYVGKADLGGTERFILENEALPSTALPSTHVPLTVEMSALNGYFFLNFIQYFKEMDYFSSFIRQLRENSLDYDVLNVTDARYPMMELPI